MIEVRNLSVAYDDQLVLRDISISFPAGKITVLLGPNGCGKSTLLKASLGLLPKKSGEIYIDGKEIGQYSAKEIAQKVAYMAQSRNIPSITVQRMVLHGRFPYLSYPRRYRPEDYEAVKKALQQADASELAHRQMAELSGGQRQKVYLAMALAQDTETIFMDEPTTYLDVRHQLEVMEVARSLAEKGKAVVLVLHDLSMALRLADYTAVLYDGRLQKAGTPEEVYEAGILDQVFGVTVQRLLSDDGWQYFCRIGKA